MIYYIHTHIYIYPVTYLFSYIPPKGSVDGVSVRAESNSGCSAQLHEQAKGRNAAKRQIPDMQ